MSLWCEYRQGNSIDKSIGGTEGYLEEEQNLELTHQAHFRQGVFTKKNMDITSKFFLRARGRD